MLDGNYPERVHKVFIVRAPSMFASVWKLVSPLVDEGTQAKISIFAGGSTPDDTPWLDEMRAFIEVRPHSIHHIHTVAQSRQRDKANLPVACDSRHTSELRSWRDFRMIRSLAT